MRTLEPEVRRLLEQSIRINTATFEGEERTNCVSIGDNSTITLLQFARDHLGGGDLDVVPVVWLYAHIQSENGVDAVVTSLPPILSICIFFVGSTPLIKAFLERSVLRAADGLAAFRKYLVDFASRRAGTGHVSDLEAA